MRMRIVTRRILIRLILWVYWHRKFFPGVLGDNCVSPKLCVIIYMLIKLLR